MESSSRYEIVDTIATGDFATVYRARDRELGREVAIKQIHQQFLHDEQQLARYWQEAQLLASLQHPNVLTIYDIVRSRGWLILELMQGNLKQWTRGQPMDLDSLRNALVACLGGLQFLHQNGVIHGDVKPSNMLVDARNRVVLGDFGLARRASSEEGSLLKGTTKYMAPELVSNQFGAVGPASDLYSLGFSAYELMCGSQFESLFPGLSTFGRDRQIAWMMWHAAADRKLPEIARVLEGVPDDLTRVIERLIVKDQAGRYRSAQEVLRDLTADTSVIDQLPAEEEPEALAAREAAAKRKRRFRLAATLAGAFVLTIAVAFLWPKPPPDEDVSRRGEITKVLHEDLEIRWEDGTVADLELQSGDDVFLNDKEVSWRDLLPGDEVTVDYTVKSKRVIKVEIHATRPEIFTGRITAIEDQEEHFAIVLGKDGAEEEGLMVGVPDGVPIVLNKGCNERSITRHDLRPDDRVRIAHEAAAAEGRKATELTVERDVVLEGAIAAPFNKETRQLGVAVAGEDRARLVYLPVAPDCQVVINGRGGCRPADLAEQDQVKIVHDAKVKRVDARRILQPSGKVLAVQRDPDTYEAIAFEVVWDDSNETASCRLAPDCTITLNGEPVQLTDLHKGDQVVITHTSVDREDVTATAIAATRPTDPTRWAIVVGVGQYDDPSLSQISHAAADAELLRDTLVGRYRVPAAQAECLQDDRLKNLKKELSRQLSEIDVNAKVVLYIAAHSYQDDDGTVYLAPKDFDLKRMSETGLPLPWLVEQFENCPARQEKLMLLDCSHAGTGDDLKRQPSTAEMMATVKTSLRTVTAIASCRPGQRGQVGDAGDHGRFAVSLAEAYRGRADGNRDGYVSLNELYNFLEEDMAASDGDPSRRQLPALFLPDEPVFEEEAKAAIRELASHLPLTRIDVGTVIDQYTRTEELAGKEPDAQLLFALLMLKAKERDEGIAHFEAIKVAHKTVLICWQGVAWARFEERSYDKGIQELLALVSAIPKPDSPTAAYPVQILQLFQWIGQLREFAAIAGPPSSPGLAALDAVVAKHGPQAKLKYDEGREASNKKRQWYDDEMKKPGANLALLRVQQRLLTNYASFPFDPIRDRIVGWLDRMRGEGTPTFLVPPKSAATRP